MKLHIFYVSVCIATLVLNLFLSRHMMRRHISVRRKETFDCDEVITFRLKERGRIEEDETETVLSDDTAALR